MNNPIWLIANKEINDNIRNRWLLINSLLLLILAFCVTFAGSAISGELVIQSSANIISGLVTLSVFLLPLSAILLSYDSFVGEEESGTLLLMLTYPISRNQFLLGKLLAHTTLMLFACLIGFVPAAIVLANVSSITAMEITLQFANFIISGLLLSMVFILLGYLVSLSVKEKAKALGLLLLLWFVVVLIYDLVLLASIVSLSEMLPRAWLNALILFNPADVFRTINLSLFETGNQVAKTALMALSQTQLSLSVLYAFMLIWLLTLFGCCQLIFKRKTL